MSTKIGDLAPRQVWITTDGTPVFVRTVVEDRTTGGPVAFCSLIIRGRVATYHHRWHQEDCEHLVYPVPIVIAPEENSVSLWQGRIIDPAHLGRTI